MTGAENLFIYWSGKRQFQQIYQTGKRPGRISLGHLDKVYQNLELSKSKSKVWSLCHLKYSEIVYVYNIYILYIYIYI